MSNYNLSIRSNYTGTKLLNNTIKSLNSSIKLFKPALKQCNLSHSYCADEFTSMESSEATCGHM
jgi:Leucine-rich repeat (LRR) protein